MKQKSTYVFGPAKFPVNPAATPAAVETAGSLQIGKKEPKVTPGADENPKMLSQADAPWKFSIAAAPPAARNEAIAEALLAIPSERLVAGSLQQRPGEAKNMPLKLDKEGGTDENPVAG